MEGVPNSEARKRLAEARGELEPKRLTEWHPVYTGMVPAEEYYVNDEVHLEAVRQELWNMK